MPLTHNVSGIAAFAVGCLCLRRAVCILVTSFFRWCLRWYCSANFHFRIFTIGLYLPSKRCVDLLIYSAAQK